jgi:single-strand DNA-binding protein
MLPTLTGTGRLTYDPELKISQNGVPVCTISLAFNSRRLNKQTQQWEDGDVYFVRGICFNALAENVAETLQKGMEVNVSGELHVDRWTDKDGQKHEMPKLMIRSIGPNLAYATARVSRVERQNGQQGGQNSRQQPAQGASGTRGQSQPQRASHGQQGPQDDPWSVEPSSDEPPF